MKDQKELLKKCLVNDIPAIVFQGSDSCAVEILQAAENIYRKNGCSPEFLIDFHENVVENFRAYQLENSIATKLPDLTTSEKEAFYILQEKEEAYFPIHIKDFEQHLKDYGFTRTYENTTSYGKYLLLKEKDYIGITGNNGNYDFAMSILKSDDGDPQSCNRYTYAYENPKAGQGRFIHTYMHDGNPLPSFEGEPKVVAISGEIDEFAKAVWENLNPDNKVSLFVRYIDIETGIYESRIINKNC